MKCVAPVPLLVAAMSAQNAPSTNKGRHLDIPAISREANGTVVSIIMADNKGQPIAQGSGFVVTRNGLVATNYHVIKNGTSAVIKFPDGSFFTVDGIWRRQGSRYSGYQGSWDQLRSRGLRRFRPTPSRRRGSGDWQSTFTRINRV